jgi:predicted RecB family nuclease
MGFTITDDIFIAYSQCPRKAFLLAYTGERGQSHELQQILEQKRQVNQYKHLDTIDVNKPNIFSYNAKNFGKESERIINVRLISNDLQAYCDILTKNTDKTYEPTIITGTYHIYDTDKLRLMFIGQVLSKVQGSPPTNGNIITISGKQCLIKLQQSHKKLTSLLHPLRTWDECNSIPDEPVVLLNKHCCLCQFKFQCESKAVHDDSLSRLNGVTSRKIRYYEKKGIFTVKQLSFLFKPRKRKKRLKNPPPAIHKIELQALAIRTGKIYIQELPTFSRQTTELFLDVESVPDQDFHYLLGLLICEEASICYIPFWANDFDTEIVMWQAFYAVINQYPNVPIYHYGSYEPRIISKLAKRYFTDIGDLNRRMVNVNKYVYGKVYFPVYSNRLKDVGRFVGASWRDPNASGIQSIVWRYKWDASHDDQYKVMLLEYNEEDCRALKLLVDELYKIQLSSNMLPDVDFADHYKQRTTEASEKIISQFNEILEFAHFNYDRNKIYFRQELENQVTEKDKTEQRKLGGKKIREKCTAIRQKTKKIVSLPRETVCPICKYEPLKPKNASASRFIVDLVLTKNGIKKTQVEYRGAKLSVQHVIKYILLHRYVNTQNFKCMAMVLDLG